MASLVFTSRTDVPSSVILEPRYLKVFTDCSLLPLTVMGILVLFSLVAGVTIILLFSALISIPKADADLSSRSVSSTSSFMLPAIKSMSSAKRRLLMLRPPILSKDSRASVIVCSRKMMKRQGPSRHPCLQRLSGTSRRSCCPLEPRNLCSRIKTQSDVLGCCEYCVSSTLAVKPRTRRGRTLT